MNLTREPHPLSAMFGWEYIKLITGNSTSLLNMQLPCNTWFSSGSLPASFAFGGFTCFFGPLCD